MIDYNDIKQAIATNLPDNNNKEITAAKLRSTLNEFVDKVEVTETGIEDNVATSIGELESETNTKIAGLREEVNTAVASIKPIEITGNVTNAPDEEDLTSVNVGGTDVLKFKDKPYTPLTYSGMGRKTLRKNIVDGVNTLTQDMFYKGEAGNRVPNTNTIFIIQYDFDLGGASIEIPENCILEFNGGSISNGVIVGANTMFKCGQQYTFKENVTFRGTYATTWLSPCNFGAKGCNVNVSNSYVITYTDKYDSTVAINNAFASGFNIEFPAGIFYITDTLIIKKRGINIKLQGDSCESVESRAFIREDYYYDKKANNSNQTVIFVEGGFNVFNVQSSQIVFKGGVIDCSAITKSINPSHICFNLDLTYDISDCVFNTFILGNGNIQNGYCTTGYFVDCVKTTKAPYNGAAGFLTGCTFDGRVSYCSKAFYIPKNPKVISGDNGNVNTWATWVTSNDLLFDSWMCRQSHVLYCGLVFRIKGSHQGAALFNDEEKYTISPIELAVDDVYLDAIMWDYSGVKTQSGLCTSYYIISTPYISDYKSYRYIASPQARNITFSPNIRDIYYKQIPNDVIKENNLITDEKGLGLRCVEDFDFTTYDTIHYNTLRQFAHLPSNRITVTGYTEDGTIDNDYFSINKSSLFRLKGASIKFNKTKSELVDYENHYIDIKMNTSIYYNWVVGYNIHAGTNSLLPKNIEILWNNEVIDSKEIFENRNKRCFKNWFRFNKSGSYGELTFRFKGLKNIDNTGALEIKIYDLFVVSEDYRNDALDYITWSSTANRPEGIDCRLNFDTDLRTLLMYSSNYGFWLTSDGYVPYKKIGSSNSIPDTLSSYNIGAPFYNQTTNKTIFWSGGKWMDFDGVEYNAVRSGTFENKPTTAQKIYIGFAYFCTDRKTTEGSTNGIMIYHKGNDVWVDALGRVVS